MKSPDRVASFAGQAACNAFAFPGLWRELTVPHLAEPRPRDFEIVTGHRVLPVKLGQPGLTLGRLHNNNELYRVGN